MPNGGSAKSVSDLFADNIQQTNACKKQLCMAFGTRRVQLYGSIQLLITSPAVNKL